MTYTALHLRPGVKEWYARWLNTYRPELTPRYRALYGNGVYAPKHYRRALAARIKPLIKAHGLDPREALEPVEPGTTAPRDSRRRAAPRRVEARDANGEWRADAPAAGANLVELELARAGLAGEPTLF